MITDRPTAWLADDERRRRIFLRWGLWLSVLLNGAIAPFDFWVTGHRDHALFEALMALSAFALLYFLHRRRSVEAIAYGAVASQGGMLLAITVSGGMQDLALTWIFVFPPLAFFLLGVRRGFVACALYAGLFWGAVVLEPQAPQWAGLTRLGVFNLVLASLTATLLTALYEVTRASAHRALVAAATHDHLTAVANRRAFERAFERELARAARHGAPLALLVADVDHFKRVNDHYGHDVGDMVLREVAQRLAGRLRINDLMGRLGGEEFGILLPDTALHDGARLAEALRRCVAERPLEASGERIELTVSLGVAVADGPATTAAGLYTAADQALLAAKRAGRNRVVEAASADDGPRRAVS